MTTPSPSVPPRSATPVAMPAMGPAGIGMGAVSIIIGILVLAWPGATLLVVAVLFGIQLIVLGALRIALSSVAPAEPPWLKPLVIVMGVLTVIAGIICLLRPGTSLLVIAIFLAIGWIFEGIAALAQSVMADRSVGARIFFIISGTISLVAGLVVALFPRDSLELLTRFGGILLVIIGIAEVIAAVMARRLTATR
ncbi:HdeD family acid-resistance protein [Humibacillus sp. DSM 29435]|uniref:HdeD family acid-resistance protein n=1 Tax=Humibacillus sp. DSM 29435 TaxID=1869167 RepID=UPI0011130F01|nr:DUF308 domain-containing protein [Humibacillus sp. DSM 29435]